MPGIGFAEMITVSPGAGLKKMRVRFKAGSQVSEISIHGWDPKTKKEIVGKAKAQGVIGEGSKQHGSGTLSFAAHEHMPTDTATAEAMAKGRMRKIAEGFVNAQVEMIGNAGLLPGAEVTFDKMGEKLDGQYRVEKAHHEFSKHGYFTRFNAVRIAKKQPPKGAAAAKKQAAQAQPAQTAWLELELVDDAGQPMAGLRYHVVTNDGQEVDGVLDNQGRARLSGIKPGNCTVSYPDLAPDAWKKA